MSLELSGTSPAIKGVAGSVAAPALTGDDVDTGISFPSANTIKFSTGGVERMSITDSGVSKSPGEVVQVIMGTFQNYYSGTNFADISSASYVTYGDMFLNITPKFANSKLIFQTNINARLDTSNAYTSYQLYDATNGASLMDAGISQFYQVATGSYPSTTITLFGTAGGTTTRRIEVRVKVTGGGTLNSDYSDQPRLMTLTEIAQ